MFLFEKLEVYQKAVAFADRVSTLTEGFPRGRWYLTDHLNRASLSISLNIPEGNGRCSPADRGNFFAIARGSVHECVPIIDLCCRKGLLDERMCKDIKETLVVLAKMLTGLIRKSKNSGSK